MRFSSKTVSFFLVSFFVTLFLGFLGILSQYALTPSDASWSTIPAFLTYFSASDSPTLSASYLESLLYSRRNNETKQCIANYEKNLAIGNFSHLKTKFFGSRQAVKHYKFPSKTNKKSPKGKIELEDADKNPNAIINKWDLRPKRNMSIHPNCMQHLPEYLEFNAFHKSGVVFSENLKMLLFRYCNIWWDSHDTKPNILYMKRHRGGFYFDRLKKNNEWKARKNKTVLLNFIRSPLDTIISAYNYHAMCPSLESAWINKPLGTYLKWKRKQRARLNKGADGSRKGRIGRRPRGIAKRGGGGAATANDTIQQATEAEQNDTMKLLLEMDLKDAARDFYFAPYLTPLDWSGIGNFSICAFHKHTRATGNIVWSLYLEFYLFSRRYKRFLDTFNHMNMLDQGYRGYNLRMEDYIGSTKDFRQFVNHLFVDILGLEFDNIDNCNDYNQFMTLMEKNDIHFLSEGHSNMNEHVTSYSNATNKIDKREQIDMLLKYVYKGYSAGTHKVINVCNKLKSWHKATGYKWEYDDYC